MCPQKYNQYNNAYYAKFNHAGLSAFVLTTGLVGLGLAFLAFGYVLRHGETLLKTTVVFSTGMCLGISVLGLFLGEMFMCVCGLMGFVGTSMYTNAVWKRIPVSFLACVFWRFSDEDGAGVLARRREISDRPLVLERDARGLVQERGRKTNSLCSFESKMLRGLYQ